MTQILGKPCAVSAAGTSSHCAVPWLSPFLTRAVVVVGRAGKCGRHALTAVGRGVDVSGAGGPSLPEVQVLVDVLWEEAGL